MQIQITTPCTVSAGELKQITGGHFCNSCQKTVIDYSNMGDAEIKAHIHKHGLGCGQFRNDQLGRELIITKTRKRNIFYYLPMLAAIFVKQPQAQARQIQDTAKVDTKTCSKQTNNTIDTNKVEPDELWTGRTFGTAGSISNVTKVKYFGIFWKWIKIPLWKRRGFK